MNTTEQRSLYEITGNIGDYNTILINRAELQQLHALFHAACDKCDHLTEAIELIANVNVIYPIIDPHRASRIAKAALAKVKE